MPHAKTQRPEGEKRRRAVSDLLSAIAAAGEQDLVDVRGRIDAAKKELEGLREVEKILDRRLHGRPERAAAGAAGGNGKLAGRIIAAIRADGPATLDDLAATLGEKPQAVRMAIQRAGRRFERVGNRYDVSERE